MRKFRKSFCYGEKGFTLIELLIVIAILGVLAAVVIPNVTRFTKSGELAAAKQELETIQTAVDACMAEQGWTAVDVTTPDWIGPGDPDSSSLGYDATDWDITDGTTTPDVSGFLRRTVEGTYQVGADGLIVAAFYKTDTNGAAHSTPANTHWDYAGGAWTEH